MSLVGTRKSSDDYPPAHPAGIFTGTVVDLIDLGMHEVWFKGERKNDAHKMGLRVFLGQVNPDKDAPLYVTQRLTLSTDPKANARKLVQQARGGLQFTKEEEIGFDYETLIGQSNLYQIVHNVVTKDGKEIVYANIDTMLPLMPGQVGPGIPDGYVREINRPPETSRDVRIAPQDKAEKTTTVRKPSAAETKSIARDSFPPDGAWGDGDNAKDMPWE